MFGRIVLVLAAGLLLAGIATACSSEKEVNAPPPAKRTLFMTALEYKGSTEVAKEPFPASKLDGSGYILKEPVEGKWETSTYRYEPGALVVYQGDDVELRIWGVNGAQHPSSIENYVSDFNVKRGQLTTVNFKADKAGLFRIVCKTHLPSMESYLLVLPR
ncbi:MAG TPA: hypothetical protein VJM69_02150 [Dehalococcoidia bacterium]|nr:hypothetical protein [Dehalococcoidia bacterium]